jgi:hypothetical protein
LKIARAIKSQPMTLATLTTARMARRGSLPGIFLRPFEERCSVLDKPDPTATT